MANDKEIIKKLLNVVAKQQKIITKLAQAQGMPAPEAPKSATFSNALKAMLPAGVEVVEAKLSLDDGVASVRLRNTQSIPGSAANFVKKMLDGKTVKSDDGKEYPVGTAQVVVG